MPQLHRFDRFALDTETTGLQYKVAEVFGVSISTPDGKDYYWDSRHEPIAGALKKELKGYKGKIIFANASFDVRMIFHSFGINLLDYDCDDVIIRASCIDEHLMSYSLDSLSTKYLGVGKLDIYEDLKAIFGGRATRNVQMPNLPEAPIELVGSYAKVDTRRTLDLWDWQEQEIARQVEWANHKAPQVMNVGDIVHFEKELMKTFIDMEMHGVRVDTNYAHHAVNQLDIIIDEQQEKIDKAFGMPLNVNSSPQVKEAYNPVEKDGEWYTGDHKHRLGTTSSGGPSLNAEILRFMGETDSKAKMILDQRSNIKQRDTFLKGHVIESSINGRVYPTINQSKKEEGGTGTGRLSITGPALQQIPSRNKKVAAVIKPCFLPDEGQVWVDTDMASFEVRVFAHLVGNPEILKAYKEDPELDFHQLVADMTGLVRNATYSGQPNAKQLNLSMIFNSGNGAIAEKMGMGWQWDSFFDDTGKKVTYRKPGKDAMKIIHNYHTRLPGIKNLVDKAKFLAESRGWVTTMYGRHIRFPDPRFSYKASGLLIQATSADINKENIGLLQRYLQPGGGRLLLNVHDSYSLSLPEHKWIEMFKGAKREIERPLLKVPLLLELNGKGKNWWEAINGTS